MHDDFAPDPAEFECVEHPLVSFMVVEEAGRDIGVFVVNAHSTVLWEIHEAFLPEAWGMTALRATIEFREWIWRESKCMRLFGQILKSNRLAIRFAKAAGMVEFGVHPESFMKGGKMQNQILVGISRPETGGH